MVLHRKLNRAFLSLFVSPLSSILGKKSSGIILGIRKNGDELAMNSNVVNFGFFCNANTFNVEWGRKHVKS